MTDQNILVVREFPLGVDVFKAFNKKQAYCDNRFNQEHTLPSSCWVDLGFEWDAVDAETVKATWPKIALIISVDGKEIENPKQYSKGPYQDVLECPKETHSGFVMANSLYLQPLPVGDHQVCWTLRFEDEVSDGWNTYPRDLIIHSTAILHVV
jgi:hypothetical protein